ncbi:ABC transporter permease [Allomesorhizobium camelthorni]|uniref:ABC transporter permease n=1 Tax=Allomesorhizobium camelthorni TaxID=475069 RepID=A0A6G4WH58_9HYPH|nr:ABC transporter permease [Mesorhizobium camelthorni]NGO53460.1 ABC transporter permease [Mesorhizobium camelthorni]
MVSHRRLAELVLVPLTLLFMWELAVGFVWTDFRFLPQPSDVLRAFLDVQLLADIALDGLHTLACALVGWAIALVFGGAIGVGQGLSRVFSLFVGTSIEILRPLPAVAFVPVAVLLFGFTIYTEIVVIVYACLWPVIVNTAAGVRGIEPRLLEVACVMHLRPLERTTKVILPAILPSAFVGARISLGLALIVAVIVEMVGNPAGLGWGLIAAQEALRPEIMFAYLMTIGILGVLANTVLTSLVRGFFPGMRELGR